MNGYDDRIPDGHGSDQSEPSERSEQPSYSITVTPRTEDDGGWVAEIDPKPPTSSVRQVIGHTLDEAVEMALNLVNNPRARVGVTIELPDGNISFPAGPHFMGDDP